MIDTHAHIDTEAFDEDRPALLQRAWDAGLTGIIIPAIEPRTWHRVLETAALDDRIRAGIGVHPHNAGDVTMADMERVEELSHRADVVAIGEIGLDYHYDFCSPDIQKSYFREQLRIAKRRGLPVIVHNRESDDDLLRIIEEEQDGTLRGVLHCFSGDVSILRRALDLGMHVSFTGNITFKKSTLNETVQSVPAGRYMIETDSPYITPVPFRGHRNEPSHVRLVAEKIAEIRTMTLQEVIAETTSTARRLFALASILVLFASAAYAQPTKPRDEDYELDEQYELAMQAYEMDSISWSKWLKDKKFGIGITVGSNTIVEHQTYTQRFFRSTQATIPNRWENYPKPGVNQPSRSFSYEGLITFGGTLNYSLTDRFTLEGTFLTAKNTKPQELFGLNPISISIVELAGTYILNPYNKVNFGLSGGGTLAMVSDGTVSSSTYGVHVGPAFGINIPTPIGLFYPQVVVRFNFMLGTDKDRVIARYPDLETGLPIVNPNNPNQVSEDRADVTTIYSIPRITISWYPRF